MVVVVVVVVGEKKEREDGNEAGGDDGGWTGSLATARNVPFWDKNLTLLVSMYGCRVRAYLEEPCQHFFQGGSLESLRVLIMESCAVFV